MFEIVLVPPFFHCRPMTHRAPDDARLAPGDIFAREKALRELGCLQHRNGRRILHAGNMFQDWFWHGVVPGVREVLGDSCCEASPHDGWDAYRKAVAAASVTAGSVTSNLLNLLVHSV